MILRFSKASIILTSLTLPHVARSNHSKLSESKQTSVSWGLCFCPAVVCIHRHNRNNTQLLTAMVLHNKSSSGGELGFSAEIGRRWRAWHEAIMPTARIERRWINEATCSQVPFCSLLTANVYLWFQLALISLLPRSVETASACCQEKSPGFSHEWARQQDVCTWLSPGPF